MQQKYVKERGIPDFPGHGDLCSADNLISLAGDETDKESSLTI
jgi:hypothetical protein